MTSPPRPANCRAIRSSTPWSRRGRKIEDERFDVLFRAIVEHEFGDHALNWTREARLDEDWVPDDPFRDEQTIRRQTPEWLAAARIFIPQRGLETA